MKIPYSFSDQVRTEEEIIESWAEKSDQLMVSIRCTTFNHAPYIEEAIKGFLIQETTFPFEIWIHDDASTDGTIEIIEYYQNSYPTLVKTVLQAENQYSKNIKPGIILAKKCKGKYIAVCEGDDYWTDPRKLQKQVDFLEANPDFVITGHDACIIDENDNLVKASKLADFHKRDYSAKDLQEGRAFILTLSWVFRRVIADDEAMAERSVVKNGDNFLLSLLGQYGAAHFHDDIQPAVYRIHQGGVWSILNKKSRHSAQATTFLMISNYYSRIGQKTVADVWWQRFDRLMIIQMSTSALLKEVLIRVTMARKFRALARRVRALTKRRLS